MDSRLIRKTTKLAAILCVSLTSFSQTQSIAPYTPHLAFDVISIRESGSGTMAYVDNPEGTSYYHAERVQVSGFILHAYDIKIIKLLENLPDWGMQTPYTVTAKSDDATDAALFKLNQADYRAEKRHMMQLLLADRFHLKIHQETRIATTYELVATERTARLMTLVQGGDFAKLANSCNPQVSIRGMDSDCKGFPFSFLVGQLRQTFGTEILDHTGMTGTYAYHLQYAPDFPKWQDQPDHFPNLQDALREQLGLELKRTKGQVTFWVIDHIERPTPN